MVTRNAFIVKNFLTEVLAAGNCLMSWFQGIQLFVHIYVLAKVSLETLNRQLIA